jgi:hypothetical protein
MVPNSRESVPAFGIEIKEHGFLFFGAVAFVADFRTIHSVRELGGVTL